MLERRISSGFRNLNGGILTLPEQEGFVEPSMETEVSYLKDAWTTHDGSWRPSDEQWSVPQWAVDDYLLPSDHKCYFDDAGADHHILSALLPSNYMGGNVGCDLLKGAGFVFWSDPRMVPAKGDPVKESKSHSGWANIVLYASSSYRADEGGGPWKCQRIPPSDIVFGMGMPWRNHVSWFLVFQMTTWREYKESFLGGDVHQGTEVPVQGVEVPHTVLTAQSTDDTSVATVKALHQINKTLKRIADSLERA